jgi:hypothetical protein
MRDDKCPNCENDITDAVNLAIVSRLDGGEAASDLVTCPHCAEVLILTVSIDTSLSRQAV